LVKKKPANKINGMIIGGTAPAPISTFSVTIDKT
jgi:hypothetical protein